MLKQRNVGVWWGAVRNLGSSLTFYLAFVNFALLLMSWYMLVNPELQKRGVFIPLFVISLLVLAGFAVVMILEHKFTMPSYFTYWNSQWWSHGNPMPDKLKAIQEQLDRIEKILEDNKTRESKK